MRLSLRTKLTCAVMAALLAVVGLVSLTMYKLAVSELTHEFGQKLVAVVASGALGIDGDAFSRVLASGKMDTPDYRAIRAGLQRLRQANDAIRMRYIYTMAPTAKPGIWQYVVDAEDPASKDFSALGDTEDLSYAAVWDHQLERPLAEDVIRYYPGWGAIISASAPIRDGRGAAVGVLSVDAMADSVTEAQRGFRNSAILFGLLGVLASVAISVPLAWQVTRPVRALMAGTAAVAQGDFSHRVVIPNRDELGELAKSFNQMTQGLKERELYKRQFERYVSRQVADKILANPEKAFWDAERLKTTILFSDIRGFTKMAERTPPEEVIRRLNEYLSLMIDIVFEHDGTLDKFIGDAVMAVFGAPMSFGNDEERAVRTAIKMQATVAELGRRWEQDGIPGFKIGVGIHSGDVVVGTIGSERRMEYSAIGDAVNLASRLESLNKEHHTTILISGSTHAAVAHLIESRFVARELIRGRDQPVEIYEVLGLKSALADAPRPPGIQGHPM